MPGKHSIINAPVPKHKHMVKGNANSLFKTPASMGSLRGGDIKQA